MTNSAARIRLRIWDSLTPNPGGCEQYSSSTINTLLHKVYCFRLTACLVLVETDVDVVVVSGGGPGGVVVSALQMKCSDA